MEDATIVHWSVESFVPAAAGRKPPPVSATVSVASKSLRAVLLATRPNHIAVEQMSVRANQNQQRLAYGVLGVVSAVAAELSAACPEGAVTSGFIAPSSKSRLMMLASGAKTTYNQRKAASVAAAERLLHGSTDGETNQWRSWFESLTKRDDASDALLLALITLRRRHDGKDGRYRVAAVDVGARNCGVCVVEHGRVPNPSSMETLPSVVVKDS